MCYAWPFFFNPPLLTFFPLILESKREGGGTEEETLTQETLIGCSHTYHDQGWRTHNRGTRLCIAFYKANVV